MFRKVLDFYGLANAFLTGKKIATGLIHETWKVTTTGNQYILQRMNVNVFKQPHDIAFNCRLISDHLKKNHPNYMFVTPLVTEDGRDIVSTSDGDYRLFYFVENSHSQEVVETKEQAYEAAMQFGRFTRKLGGIDLRRFKITIPFFHDLSFRYSEFLHSIKSGNAKRIIEADILIKFLMQQHQLVKEYDEIKINPDFKLRVTHHDTKISNVLFDNSGKGICVIDLDTVMPGYYISDLGDMVRTYLSPVTEEESDFTKIEISVEMYMAVIKGYLSEMKDELTESEKTNISFAGKYMTYMQALRFITDYLNNDIYYGARYPTQNLVRAGNQTRLLEVLQLKEKVLQNAINSAMILGTDL